MADNPQGFGPYFCWEKPVGETKLSPLRAHVHELLAASQGTCLHLDDIYAGLSSPADTSAKKTAVRMALKDLMEFQLASELASPPAGPPIGARAVALELQPAQEVPCHWACSPDDQTTDLMNWLLDSLQKHSKKLDPECQTDIWWDRPHLYADVRANHDASGYSDHDMDQALQDLYKRARPCVKRQPLNDPTKFAPLKTQDP